jgi:hypothetical protein
MNMRWLPELHPLYLIAIQEEGTGLVGRQYILTSPCDICLNDCFSHEGQEMDFNRGHMAALNKIGILFLR